MNAQLIDGRVDLQNCSIFYQQSGRESGATPILFLHGWGISAEPYHEILGQLAQNHALIAPDLPSFARSPYPHLISNYETYANFILEFMDALNLDQVHLAGHSLGGGIAITLAALYPDRVKSTILIDSTGIPAVPLWEEIPKRAIEMTAQISLPKLKLQMVDIPKVFSHNLLFNTGNVVQALLMSLHHDIRHLMPKIQAPSLLLWSQKDLTTPLESAHEMNTLISNSKLITVEEGWHEWGLWYPEKFTSIISDFVHQVEKTPIPLS